MPKLGLGINVANSSASGSAGGQITTLYSDSLIAWPNTGATFRDRQIFSSSSSGTVVYGGGVFQQITGAAGRHSLVYFNCDKELYPVYTFGNAYALNSEVYGGAYGHAIFRKTALGGGTTAPLFLGTTPGTQDPNGWTRIHPTLTPLGIGQAIVASFNFKAVSPGTGLTTANSLRFAILDSSIPTDPKYVNADNHGLSNAIFGGNGGSPGYRGYMSTISASGGVNANKVLIRTTTTSSSLVNSTTGVYTQVANTTATNLAHDVLYAVSLKVQRTAVNTIVYTWNMTGGSLTGGLLSYTDNSPSTFVFDTLAFDVVADACSAFEVSNVKAVRGPSSL
jgi:hypothetical protein